MFRTTFGIAFFIFSILYTTASFCAPVFTATFTCTPVNHGCTVGDRNVAYSLIINAPAGYTYGTDFTYNSTGTKFELKTGGPSGTLYAQNGLGITIASGMTFGTFAMSSFPRESYIIYATININNTKDGISQIVTAYVNFASGYEIAWSDMLNMQTSPNNYSAVRSVAAATGVDGRTITANKSADNDDVWMEIGAQFNNPASEAANVYFIIGESNQATLSPSSNPSANYVEFRKTSTGGNVYLRYNGSSYGFNIANSSRVVIRRASGVLRFYVQNSTTPLSGIPTIPYTGKLNVCSFSTHQNVGPNNIYTSYGCLYENHYYHLNNEVDESLAYLPLNLGYLRLKYNEDYFDNSGVLSYTVKCLDDDSAPVSVTVSKTSHTNWINIPTGGTGGLTLLTNKIYLLQVSDVKGRKQYLKFKTL